MLALALAAAAGTLSAQATPPDAPGAAAPNRNTRHGFWFGLGLADGSAGFSCGGCSTSRISDVAAGLRLGGTVNQHLLLGGEVNGWSHSAGGVDQALAFATAVAYWYPSATGALYLSVGLGAMTYSTGDGTNGETATAGAAQLGLGYDIRVGRKLSITPFLNGLTSTSATFSVNGVPVTSQGKVTMSLAQIGVAATWH